MDNRDRPNIVKFYTFINYLFSLIILLIALWFFSSTGFSIVIIILISISLLHYSIAKGLWEGRKWAFVLQAISIAAIIGLNLKALLLDNESLKILTIVFGVILLGLFIFNKKAKYFFKINNTTKESIKDFKEFMNQDSLRSLLVSLCLIVIGIFFALFPTLSFLTGTPLPLVIVESCSMYHDSSKLDTWWTNNGQWYESRGITKEEFSEFTLKRGINKGDIILVIGKDSYKTGDIIIFTANTKYPIIHRMISQDPPSTKGDNNPEQLSIEKSISQEVIQGKAIARIPYLGWIKLIFFEPLRPTDQRGFCK